jgi:hypothetical protein
MDGGGVVPAITQLQCGDTVTEWLREGWEEVGVGLRESNRDHGKENKEEEMNKNKKEEEDGSERGETGRH